ncbi:MAG TPA: hypothetical protein VHD81_03810 [Mycobacteriales bacterium]|nr:hypothetical protein [Mycobacteriales bacterium]
MDEATYQRLLHERQAFFVPFYLQVVDEHPAGIEAREAKRLVFQYLVERYGIDVTDPTVIPINPSTGRTQADQWANNLISNRVLDEYCVVDRTPPVRLSARPYPTPAPTAKARATEVPIEAANTERYERHGSAGLTPADRAEAALVRSYAQATGTRFVRHRIDIPDEPWPLFTDLYDPSSNTLIEAKSSASRNDVRAAIGQLLDYSRFLDSPDLAILLPQAPSRDLCDLLEAHNIRLIVHEMASPQPDSNITDRPPRQR